MIKIGQDILSYQDKVIEWNELFGNSVNNKDLVEDYKNYTIEEIGGKNELIHSALSDNYEGVLDAVCDIIYTGFMYLSLVGKPFVKDEEFKDITKGVSFLTTGVTMNSALKNGDIDKFKMYLINILTVSKDKFDLDKAFARVTESNFSKAFTLPEGASSHELYKYREAVEKEGRYKDIFFEYHNGRYIAKAKTDTRENKTFDAGKIIKSDYWYSSVEKLGGLKSYIK